MDSEEDRARNKPAAVPVPRFTGGRAPPVYHTEYHDTGGAGRPAGTVGQEPGTVTPLTQRARRRSDRDIQAVTRRCRDLQCQSRCQ